VTAVLTALEPTFEVRVSSPIGKGTEILSTRLFLKQKADPIQDQQDRASLDRLILDELFSLDLSVPEGVKAASIMKKPEYQKILHEKELQTETIVERCKRLVKAKWNLQNLGKLANANKIDASYRGLGLIEGLDPEFREVGEASERMEAADV
jgi:hypothetical protein